MIECDTKMTFNSNKEALKYVKSVNKGEIKHDTGIGYFFANRPYKCSVCNKYHLTSQQKLKRKKFKRNKNFKIRF